MGEAQKRQAHRGRVAQGIVRLGVLPDEAGQAGPCGQFSYQRLQIALNPLRRRADQDGRRREHDRLARVVVLGLLRLVVGADDHLPAGLALDREVAGGYWRRIPPGQKAQVGIHGDARA